MQLTTSKLPAARCQKKKKEKCTSLQDVTPFQISKVCGNLAFFRSAMGRLWPEPNHKTWMVASLQTHPFMVLMMTMNQKMMFIEILHPKNGDLHGKKMSHIYTFCPIFEPKNAWTTPPVDAGALGGKGYHHARTI